MTAAVRRLPVLGAGLSRTSVGVQCPCTGRRGRSP